MYDKLLKDPSDVPHNATFKVDWVLNKIKAYIRLNGEKKMLVLISKYKYGNYQCFQATNRQIIH